MSSAAMSPVTPSGSIDPRISAIIDYLEIQPPNSVPSLRAFALKLNVSESYLRHRFKEAVGLPFGEYVRRLRFGRARMLLANSTMSVKEARLEIGMLDHSSFTKTYKKYFGETPSSTKRGATSNKWELVLVSPLNRNSAPIRQSA